MCPLTWILVVVSAQFKHLAQKWSLSPNSCVLCHSCPTDGVSFKHGCAICITCPLHCESVPEVICSTNRYSSSQSLCWPKFPVQIPLGLHFCCWQHESNASVEFSAATKISCRFLDSVHKIVQSFVFFWESRCQLRWLICCVQTMHVSGQTLTFEFMSNLASSFSIFRYFSWLVPPVCRTAQTVFIFHSQHYVRICTGLDICCWKNESDAGVEFTAVTKISCRFQDSMHNIVQSLDPILRLWWRICWEHTMHASGQTLKFLSGLFIFHPEDISAGWLVPHVCRPAQIMRRQSSVSFHKHYVQLIMLLLPATLTEHKTFY